MFEMWTCHVVVCDECGLAVDENDLHGPTGEVTQTEAIRIAEAAGYHVGEDMRATCPECLLLDVGNEPDDRQLSFEL